MTRSERRVFSCIVEYAVAPAAPLPPISETDALEAFDRYLAASPPVNRLGLRAALAGLELAPVLLGPERKRLSALSEAARGAFLNGHLRGRLGAMVLALRGLAQVSYYGDQDVMSLLGYDASANVERGRAVRQAEGRW